MVLPMRIPPQAENLNHKIINLEMWSLRLRRVKRIENKKKIVFVPLTLRNIKRVVFRNFRLRRIVRCTKISCMLDSMLYRVSLGYLGKGCIVLGY